MDRYLIAGGLIIAAAAAIFAWGLCRAAAHPMPAPDHADDCPDFIEPADDAEDAEWLLLMAEVDGDFIAWSKELQS